MSAALELFVDRGFHNVSVHDIQKHAGVSIGSIYNHFGGKEGVADGLYKHLLGELDQLIDHAIEGTPGAIEQCNAVVKSLFEFTESQRYIMAFLLDAKHTEFLQDGIPVYSSSPFVRLQSLLADGIKQSHIKNVDPWIALVMVFGGPIRLVNLRLEGSLPEPLMHYFDELMNSIWSGLAVES